MGLGTSVAWVSLTIALATYRSYENRVILGLWSPQFLAVLLGAACLAAISVVRSMVLLRRNQASPSLLLLFVEGGVAAIGIAYLLGTLAGDGASRLLDGNLWGSAFWLAGAVSWVALGLFLGAGATAAFGYRRFRLARLVMMAVPLLAFLWILEGLARAQAYVFPVTQNLPTYSALVWAHRFVQRNASGWRDTEHSITPAPGTRRLVLLGDSFAFGVGIKQVENRLGEQLARLLAVRCAGDWELLTFAQQDTHTLQHEQFLREALRFGPTVVVLEYVFNDIEYLRPAPRRGPQEAVGSVLQRLNPVRLMYYNSLLFQQLYVRYVFASRRTSDARHELHDRYLDSTLLARHLHDLSTMDAIADSAGTLLVVLPVDVSVAADSNRRARYHQVVDAMVGEGLRVLNTSEVLEGTDYQDLIVNELDHHPNERANAALAGSAVPGLAALLPSSTCPAPQPAPALP
jgi:hypothetical protein